MYIFGVNIDEFKYNKPKVKKQINTNNHNIRLLHSIIGMLEYDNVYDGLDTNFMELYKILDGKVGIVEDKDKIIAFRGEHSNIVNAYGVGTHFIGASALNSYDIVDGKNGVVGYNNKLMTSDYFEILKYSEIFANIDISAEYNIMYSKYNPLFSVKNQKIKEQITQAFNNMNDGKPLTIVSKLSDELLNEGIKPIEVINLTDVKNIDKLQYLLKAFDDYEKQFYRHFGISLNTSTKMAQQSEEEINQTQSLAMIYPIERLKCANEMCKKMNKLYGGNMTVHFSEVWEQEYIKYTNSVCVDEKTEEMKKDILMNNKNENETENEKESENNE